MGEILGGMRLKPVGVEASGRGRGAKAGRELNGVYFRKEVNWRDGKKVFTLKELGVESKKGLSSEGTGILLGGSEKKPYRCCYESLHFTQSVYGLSVCASPNSSGKILRPKGILSGDRALQHWLAEPSVTTDEIRVLVERSQRDHASFLLRKEQQRNLMHRSKTGQYLPVSTATMPLFISRLNNNTLPQHATDLVLFLGNIVVL